MHKNKAVYSPPARNESKHPTQVLGPSFRGAIVRDKYPTQYINKIKHCSGAGALTLWDGWNLRLIACDIMRVARVDTRQYNAISPPDMDTLLVSEVGGRRLWSIATSKRRHRVGLLIQQRGVDFACTRLQAGRRRATKHTEDGKPEKS